MFLHVLGFVDDMASDTVSISFEYPVHLAPSNSGVGTFLAERAINVSYFKIYFYKSHRAQYSCHLRPKDCLIRY